MGNPDGLTESEFRRAVEEGTSNAVKSVFSNAFWTVLAVFTILVGLQAIQMAFYTIGIAAIGFVTIGVLITVASVYLLYLLHWG